ncbi:MAG: methyl-accepting chemotaxis protein [Thaumarchaeota archaeon]|nr:methyl-accepting chemotaxis protein [Nitrososphaerota archaeon]
MTKQSNRSTGSAQGSKKRDPNRDVLKKMTSISETTKVLANEVKSMSKIFADNQKILISLKNMIDAVTSSLEAIQRNARQINILEEDTQKLFSGLGQVKTHSNLISKVNEQTQRLQHQVSKIQEKQESLPDVNKIMQSVADSLDSIRNNTKMIMHVSDKTEKIRDEIKTVASKTESLANMSNDIRDVGIELGALVRKTDALETFSTDIRNVGLEFSNFKENVMGKTKEIDEKVSELTEMLNRNVGATSEFHKKTHEIHQELQEIRSITHKTSQNTSREVIGLLRLAEFQSTVRMHSESKYGTLDDLDKMISQTVEMVNLFDRLSIESEKKIPLPQEVKQWSISKILDCADRWEIRFTDVFRLLITQLGRDLVKESIRIEQVRDLFGIRAVDEVRNELNVP